MLRLQQAALRFVLVVAVATSTCQVPHPSDATLSLEGADLQYQLLRYFDGLGPPPLEEVFFATQNLTREVQEKLLHDCPGLLLSSFLVVAEARLPVAPNEANAALAKAEALASRLSPEAYEVALDAWPVQAALASFHQAAAAVGDPADPPPSVHIVVCHCRESIDWLVNGELYLPQDSHEHITLFVYEKCGLMEDPAPLSSRFLRVSIVPVQDGDTRRDECSAYLRHLVDYYEDPADFTIFLQSDVADHAEWGYFSLVMRAIERRALNAPFVHLNYPRLVSSMSPCKAEVFRQIFGRPPERMLGSYCCAQFLVSKQRVRTNPLSRYQRMLEMLFEDSPQECHDIEGHSTHCLMFEVYWHVLFGEMDSLPERADNAALPLFLRIRDIENEAYLPPDSMYLNYALDE